MSGYEGRKMRKRNVSWSSSPSTSYRFKQAIMMAKRGGSTTPTQPPPEEEEKEVSTRKLGATARNPAHHHHSDNTTAGSGDRLKEVMKSLAVSKELLQLLRSAWEQRSVRSSLFSALRLELERALVQAAAEEQWSRGERDRTRLAVAAEVRAERRLRHQAERLNRRLGSELAEMRATAERERRAQQLAAQTFGKSEREGQMVQVVDLLREDRVHMKLSYAKYELEKKNAAVEQLRCDLQAYLKAGPAAINHGHRDEDDDEDDDDDDIIITNNDHDLCDSQENIQWSDICFNTSINQ